MCQKIPQMIKRDLKKETSNRDAFSPVVMVCGRVDRLNSSAPLNVPEKTSNDS